jgi:hypothetical protein
MVSRSFVILVISALAIAALAFAVMHNPSADEHRAELRAASPETAIAGVAAYHSLRFVSYTEADGRVVSIGLFGIVLVSSVALIQIVLAIGALVIATGIFRVATKKVHLAKPFWDRSGRSLKALSDELKALPKGYWFFISLVLYVLSLFLPFAHGARGDGVPGWLALIFGWIYLFGESPAWLANPMLFLTWLFLSMRLPRTAVIFASIAFFSAVPFIFGPTLTVGWGGVRDRLTPNIGYFLWLGSILAGLFGAIRLGNDARWEPRSSSDSPAPDNVLDSSQRMNIDLSQAGQSNPSAEDGSEPRGICPNCGADIPLASLECGHCKAPFGAGAAWKANPRP